MYKHYSTLYKFYPWNTLFPPHLVNDDTLAVIEDFEKYIIRKITKYVIFKPSFIDLLSIDYEDKSKNENEVDIRNYLVNYCMVTSFEGKLSTLYSEVRSFISEQK